jgi:uncharacterized protein YuzE
LGASGEGRIVFRAKVTVDTEAGALYVQLAEDIERGEAVINESFSLESRGTEVVFDLSARQELLGIEIIGIDGLLKGQAASIAPKVPGCDSGD